LVTHKAQGATVDQTFVLADDTLHRERSYSSLSRGVEANSLYLAVPDDDHHHGSPQDEDLIERLRDTVNHSDAKTLALEDLRLGRPPARGAHDALRAERLRLAPIVNRAPRPPFDALAALRRDQERAAANLAKARRERQAAEEALERLGGHRRLTRRRGRQQAEDQLSRAERLETGAESVLQKLGERRTDLNKQVAEWTTWTAQHRHEASRLREVDALVADHHRQHQPTVGRERGITRDAGHDTGIDLGL
jgi:flagellar biosynthesis chaperone FliJ